MSNRRSAMTYGSARALFNRTASPARPSGPSVAYVQRGGIRF